MATFSIYRGAAIMGDGRVLLVLDTEEVVKHAR
ncbi:chemotaxis protein CheA [Vibrio cholerae]|nr:chemotaxis protein CheA [Vibrio cholerae]